MAKLTLTDLANLQNETTAVTRINNNNAAIETAVENTLSRDGTSPNEMQSDLDMNSNQIYNLPVPEFLSSAARWQDVINLSLATTLTGINGFLFLNLATSIPSTTVAANVEGIYVSGYSTAGVGPAFWRKVPSLPTHTAYRQSANGYYFVPAMQRLDSTMSPATTGDQVIDAAIALGCGFELHNGETASITLGTAIASDFSTISSLKTFLSKSKISEGATLTIKINGIHSQASSSVIWDWNHPDSDRIVITCGDNYTVITGRTIQSSGHSVSGTFRDYSVTFKLNDVTGISVGDVLRVNNVKSNYRIEDAFWGSNAISIGQLTRTGVNAYDVGNASGTAFVHEVFENALTTSDLILWKGESRRVATILDGNSFTTAGAEFSNANLTAGNQPSGEFYWYRLAGGFGTGNLATSPVPGTHSTTVNVTDTSPLKKGAIIVADGQAGRIVSIDSATAITVHCLMDIPANTPFAMIGLSYCFEGAHEITNVDTGANTVTVLCKACLPESVFDFSADYIKGGDVDVIRAGLKNSTTGDVFNFRGGERPQLIDNIVCFPGSGGYAIETGTTHTNQMPAISIQLGAYFTVVGGAGGIYAWNSNIKCQNVGGTTQYNSKGPMFSGCGAVGAPYVIFTWGGTHYLHSVKVTGCINSYAYFGQNGAGVFNANISVIAGCNSGSYTLQGCGITGDYQKYYFTGWTLGTGSEAGTYVAFRSVGTSSHDVLSKTIGHAGDGLVYNVGSSGRIAGALVLGVTGFGVINNSSTLEGAGVTVMGCGSQCYYSTGTGELDSIEGSFTNSTAASMELFSKSVVTGSRQAIRKGGTYCLSVQGDSHFDVEQSFITGGNIADISKTGFGGDINILNAVNTPVLAAGYTINIIDNGNLIRNTDTIYFPQILTNTKVIDFGVINSDARATDTITVTGAVLGDPVLVTTTAAAFIGDTATRCEIRAWVSATDTVTVEVMNTSATNSSDLPSATYKVAVLKWT